MVPLPHVGHVGGGFCYTKRMEILRNGFFLLIGLVVVVGSFISVLSDPAPEKYQVSEARVILKIGEAELEVEVADTDADRTLGLSGRNELPRDRGMLFVFPTSGNHGIWMKDMNFPIDIIWLDEEKKVVHIEREVRPETFPYVFYPTVPAKYVLEVANAGSFDLGIDIGTQAFFNLEN